VGPGNDHRFLDIDSDILDRRVLGNLTSQLDVTRRALAHMVERGCGTIVNLTSPAGYAAPFALPGKGGWGMPYAVSKAGFHRIAVQVAFEYGDRGIVALNAQPGMVATERIMAVGRSRELIAKYGAAPEVVGRTLAHVVAAANDGPESLPWPNGDTVELQDLAHTLGWLDSPGRFPDPT
jgi:NAD(P)-dependent dehydrogenase (short-subunit alcohol dehydrogenase family)